MSLRHWVPFAIASLCVAAPASATSSGVVDFVQKNCVACHNSKSKAGDLDLASQLGEGTFHANRGMWEKVLDKLKTGQMPPPALPRPPAGDVAEVTRGLETEFARQDRLVKPAAGRVSARGLNRAEYNNTIRDLLAVDIRPADAFPADDSAFGFDNISDALNLSPALLEKYVDAAERVVRTAIFGPERLKPSMIHYPTPVRINDSRGHSSLPKDLFHYDLTGLSTLHSAHIIHRFPVDAEYSFRLVLNGHRPNQSEPVHPALYIDGKLVQQWEYDATDLEGQIVEGRARVTAGEHLLSATYLKTYHGLPPSYHGPEPSKRPAVALISTRGKLTEQDIETLRKYGTKIKTDSIETRVDNRFESIDVGGPFHQVTAPPAESLRKVFVCGHAAGKHTDTCARMIVTNFAGRAFRRPAGAKEVDGGQLRYGIELRIHEHTFLEGRGYAAGGGCEPEVGIRAPVRQLRPEFTGGSSSPPVAVSQEHPGPGAGQYAAADHGPWSRRPPEDGPVPDGHPGSGTAHDRGGEEHGCAVDGKTFGHSVRVHRLCEADV
ncbi:MAG: DUF1587 domain-containing protein [Bryobacterales bacterium]|nr:DUF1587 domain-containing protein [Bryobacterales bacterium]